jgi:hypothetical protein
MDDKELESKFDALMRRINDNQETLLVRMRDLQTSTEIELRMQRTIMETTQGLVLKSPMQIVDALQKPLIDRLAAVERRVTKLEGERPSDE